jgi:hypothetical protein
MQNPTINLHKFKKWNLLLNQITIGQSYSFNMKLLSHHCFCTLFIWTIKQRVNANQLMVTTLHGDVFPSGHIGSTSCHCQKDLWTGSRNGHAVHHLGANKTVEMCAVVNSGAQNNVYTTIGRNPPCTAVKPSRNGYLHKPPLVSLHMEYASLWFPHL